MLRKFLSGFALLFLFLSLVAIARAHSPERIASVGGKYFEHRVELAVPAFAQDDPRWTDIRLGSSSDTLGVEGCAVTSAAMVAAFYGVKTDPQQLNDFLTRTGGLDNEGLIDWNQVPSVAPACMKLVYNGAASYEIIDQNLLAGNPVIVVIPLQNGAFHFVVIVGKEGWDYLIRDPAASGQAYPLSDRANWIGGMCVFHAAGLSGPG